MTGTSGMKWLRPLLLQAITMGELKAIRPSEPLEQHSECVGGECVGGECVHSALMVDLRARLPKH